MTPLQALDRAIYYLDRAHEDGFKAKAFLRAREVLRGLDPAEVASRSAAGTLTDLDGIGAATARLVREALATDQDGPTARGLPARDEAEPDYLQKLESETRVPLGQDAARYRAALRGDCHLHTRWSDGAVEIEQMVATAIDLGHEYLVLTDHSPRLTVAHGLDRDRLEQQLVEVDTLNARFAPFRILTGMEVDILEDGSLDLDDDLLERLDVVVASVHSKLSMERTAMTQRMVLAVASPHVDILGHCTGRLIGKRTPSTFDADFVFAACAQFDTAVEINCRPERLDPPAELLELALQYGCRISIDTDAHSPGQLEWLPLGCEKAAEAAVPLERIVNTWSADALLEWAGR